MNIVPKCGVFRLFDRNNVLILTDEKQLDRIINHPDKPLFDDEERGFSGEKKGLYPPGTTLESFCKNARKNGGERVEVSYDFFFGGATRTNYPDSEKTVKAFKVIHDYAKQAGMDFGASLISPLDIGGGFARKHKNTGFSWQFQECSIDKNGVYNCPMVLQRQWYNNKGPIQLKLERVHVVAFDEEPLGEGLYYVDENAIIDISKTAVTDIDKNSFAVTGAGWGWGKMIVSGKTEVKKTKALVVAVYRTPELDYFDQGTNDYMHSVIDMHNQAGIRYQGYYSDEMHIQFDWDLTNHFGPTEITTRYVTDSLIAEYARRYGAKYRDFLKYMVYFAYAQHGKGESSQHVFGKTTKAVYETWLFRKRYFEMLSRRVVDLSIDALRYSERLFGGPVMTRAHATWQESPTCDRYNEDDRFSAMAENAKIQGKIYDYTPEYIWSSSIRENVSACYDYFRWNDFLTGSGNDHPEGGNSDRNYYAEALACSFGVLNRFPLAYCGSWGSPAEVLRRLHDVGDAYGNACSGIRHAMVQEFQHRDTDVLLLYPLELNYVQERFGSWMVQYGYGNYITEEKLLEHGCLTEDGRIEVIGRRYRGLVVLFEPFVKKETLAFLNIFVRRGGKLIWMAAPVVMDEETGDTGVAKTFLKLFGLKSVSALSKPHLMGGKSAIFQGSLKGIKVMKIATNFLPDYVYGIKTHNAELAALVGDIPAGSVLKYPGGGLAAYFGFRLRDDQSGSGGGDVSTLFDVLKSLGAYDPKRLELRSRPKSARYIMNSFPNGTVSIANHYRTFAENWYGSFFRDEKKDAKILKGRKLPPVEIELKNETIMGHKISYKGLDVLSYRLDPDGSLAGFSGSLSTGITVDGNKYTFSNNPVDLTWIHGGEKFKSPLINGLMLVMAGNPCRLTIPNCLKTKEVYAGACSLDFYTTDLPAKVEATEKTLNITVTKALAGKWIAVWI
jgi:hypothetical protein